MTNILLKVDIYIIQHVHNKYLSDSILIIANYQKLVNV